MTTRQQTRQGLVPGPIVAFVLALAALAVVSFVAIRYDRGGSNDTTTETAFVAPSSGGDVLTASEQFAYDMAVLEAQWDEVFGPMKVDPVASAIAEHDNAIAGALGSQVSFESSIGFPQKLMDQTVATALAEHENAIAAIWGAPTGSTASSTSPEVLDFETALKIAQGDIESSVAPYVR